MRRNRGGFLLALIFTVLVISPLSAHEGRELGNYTIEIGWREEPAYTGLLNGPEITVTRHEADGEANHDEVEVEATAELEEVHTNPENAHETESNGVEGLEDTLQIEVSFGPEARVLNLRAIPDEPGHYTANLIPTRPGDYTFRVFGTIEATEVDETFSAADGQFSTVEPIEDIQFP
jgi:hypothetical protein